MGIHSETDTVVKRILPYLSRRGYDLEKDLDFEVATKSTTAHSTGYVDLLVTCGGAKPLFVIEAKKSSKVLNAKDAKQALAYGASHKVPFVVVTNGKDIRCYNVRTKQPLRWDGKLIEKIPTRDQLKKVLSFLKTNPDATDVPLSKDESLPFRPGLPLKQLNALFSRCHNTIRKIEKDEENAFDDFSKLLFLKLLEEKADTSDFELPYSYRFHELAERPDSEADQVRDAIQSMIEAVRKRTSYGEVLQDPIELKNAKTFKYIVEELAAVSFHDSSLDSKGAAFEYFVRATLKGKKLGQYFTPRPLVKLMNVLVGQEKIYNALRASTADFKVIDPACGTGGFLIYLMQDVLSRIEVDLQKSKITKSTAKSLSDAAKQKTFFGMDANDGVACAAKMNMIIAGDGHTNIQPEDSLTVSATNWRVTKPDCHIVITNPPFGTSEKDSLSSADWGQYDIKAGRGQQLFLQKMILCCIGGGDICTVIDDGLLNTATSKSLRRWIFEKCQVRAVVRLPEDTFKPNKINVRSSVLLLQRYDVDDPDLDANNYNIQFIDIKSLGYLGSGELIRGFDIERLYQEIEGKFHNGAGTTNSGYNWEAFQVPLNDIKGDGSYRLDWKYWYPAIRQRIKEITDEGGVPLAALNTIKTKRGKSPSSDLYVDEADGYALVVKAGTNITKYGSIATDGDYIEKDIYEEMPAEVRLQKGDVLLASTGTGTLGKACVYDLDLPAIADGHVTIIRPDLTKINPYYLADYLRVGFGHDQIERLYTGSTGLIELTPEDVDALVVDVLDGDLAAQELASKQLRDAEATYKNALDVATSALKDARSGFGGPDGHAGAVLIGDEQVNQNENAEDAAAELTE